MVKHGMVAKSKLYGVWKSKKQRCSNPNNKDYYDDGGRGIQYVKAGRKITLSSITGLIRMDMKKDLP